MCFLQNDILFSEIYSKYSNMIFKICYIHVKNKHDAEEAVQHTFTKLYTCDKEFNDDEHVRAWLITVASNYCNSLMRSWWMKNKFLFDHEYLDKNVPNYDVEELVISKENNKENNENIKHVISILKGLPRKYKNPIILYYYYNYDIKQIAIMLNQNENTIKTWLKRSKEKIKELLDKEEIYEKTK